MPVKAFRISMGLALLALTFACTRKDRDEVALQAGKAEIKLKCNSGSFSAEVNPWRVTMADLNNKKAIRWKLVSQGNSATFAEIDSVDGKPWPFRTKKFRAAEGDSVDADLTDALPGQETLYHYKITTTCSFNGVTDTIVIDPDMILPPRNAQ